MQQSGEEQQSGEAQQSGEPTAEVQSDEAQQSGEPTAEALGGRGTGLFSAALLVIALLPRLWVVWRWAPKPAWDGVYYDIGARSIAAGLGYVGKTGKPWCHYPVGYSAALGLSYRIFGASHQVALISNALVGALVAVMTYWLARHLVSERRARIAGLLVALYPGLVLYAGLLMTEVLAVALLLAAALIAARCGTSWRGLAVAGIVLGLGALVRPQTLLCAPLLALFARADRGAPIAGRALWWRIALVSGMTLAAVLPWTLRNCVVMDGCALVSTNAGWNLSIGAFPRATGRYAILREGDGCYVVTGQVQQNRCWMKRGVSWIVADPERWLGLIDDKLAQTFDHESFPVGYLAEAAPEAWPEARRAQGRGVLSWCHRALLTGAALAALPRARRDRPVSLLWLLAVGLLAWFAAMTVAHPFWPLALVLCVAGAWRAWNEPRVGPRGVWALATGLVASLVLLHAVFFGEDRYHLVATPLLAIVAVALGARSEPAAARAGRAAVG